MSDHKLPTCCDVGACVHSEKRNPHSVSVDFVNASSDVADSLDMILKLMVDLKVDLGEEDAALLENAAHRLETFNGLYSKEIGG